MKKERPNVRSWFIALADTPVLESPLDIATALAVMGDDMWHCMDSALRAYQQAFRRSDEVANTQNEAIGAMNIFVEKFPKVSIRRTVEKHSKKHSRSD